MSSDQQLADDHEHFEALLTEYDVELYEECFYTDSAWENLVADAENTPYDTEAAQLADFERFEALFNQYCQDLWVWFSKGQE